MSSGSHTSNAAGLFAKHQILEKNPILLAIAILILVSIGGLVQIVPLFYLQSTVEKVDGMRPYTPLELAGRNIFVREGCYLCHSQMIRSLRDEVERYGHYSLAAESMYDHPFQWGSKRNGPDLARVGLKYTDTWQVAHLRDPRSVVPQSIMPSYAFLEQTPLDASHIAENMKTLAITGVPSGTVNKLLYSVIGTTPPPTPPAARPDRRGHGPAPRRIDRPAWPPPAARSCHTRAAPTACLPTPNSARRYRRL